MSTNNKKKRLDRNESQQLLSSEFQTPKKQKQIPTNQESSSNEIQEVNTPLRQKTTLEVEQPSKEQTPKKNELLENYSLDETSLELIADDDEEYDANYEKLLQTDDVKDSTLLEKVTEYNLNTLGNRDNKKNFVKLFSEALVQIHFDHSKFETSDINISESKYFSLCEVYLEVMKLYVDLESVNELFLQCCSVFPMLVAMLAYSGIYMTVNGGGKYKVPELHTTAKSLSLNSVRLHSDVDFCLDNTKIKNENIQTFPTTFYPYFAVYELKKTSKVAAIEQHYDFVKIIGVLRAIAKSYAVTLRVGPADLEKICIWGVLQSSTTVWFLQCNIEATEVLQNNFSLLYHITCSEPFYLQKDNESIIKIYCRIIQSGKELQTLLESFKPNLDIKYPRTNISKQLSHLKYKKATLEEPIIQFLTTKSHTLRILSGSVDDEYTRSFTAAMHSNFQWNYKGYAKYTTIHEIFFLIGGNETDTIFYVLVDYLLKEVPKSMAQNRNTDIFKYSIICQREITDKRDNEQYIVFQFESSNVIQLSHSDMQVPIQVDRASQQQDELEQSGSSHQTKQQSVQQQQKSTANLNTKYDILPSNRLEIAFQNATVPFKYNIHCKHETCRGIYCVVTKRGIYGNNFLKVAEGFMHLEAVEVMKKLERKELEHKNLVRVLKYDLALGPDKCGQIVAATETELLIHYSDEIPMQFKNKLKFVDWIIEDVFFGALDGLHYLHQNQVIHGDVSVNNIMFRRNYSTKETYSVLIDLNDSIPCCNLNRPIILYGTEGYVPKTIEKPSIFTDCYGLVVSICVFVYYALFGEMIDLSKNFNSLFSIFKISNWNLKCTEENRLVAQFISNLHELFECIVIQTNDKALPSSLELKKYFQTKYLLVSSEDKENISNLQPVKNSSPALKPTKFFESLQKQ